MQETTFGASFVNTRTANESFCTFENIIDVPCFIWFHKTSQQLSPKIASMVRTLKRVFREFLSTPRLC